MKKPALLFLLIALFSLTQAQELWDWKKCIDFAMDNNLQLKMSAIQTQLAEVEVKRNKFEYSPTVYGKTNYSLGIGNNYNYFTNQYEKQVVHYNDYNFNVIQPIFDGLVIPNNIKRSKSDLEALKLDNEVLRSNIQLQILTAFLNILNAEEQYNQSLNLKKNTQDQYDRTKILIDAGSLPENSIVDIDVQLASEDVTLQELKSQIDLSYLSLKLILQMDPEKDIKVVAPSLPDSLDLPPLPSSKEVYAVALSIRPEIKSKQLRIESAKRSIKIANGNRMPTLTLTGNINSFFSSQNKTTTYVPTGNYTTIGLVQVSLDPVIQPEYALNQERINYFNQFKNQLSYAVGLSLNIPIYSKNSVHFAVQQARLNVQLAELNKSQAEQDLYNSIKQAYVKALNAEESYKSAKINLDAAQKSLNYNTDRLNGGLGNQLELNLAKNNLANAQSRLIQAKYEYIFNSKVLDYYQGKTITLE